ncbi:hypothetical protein MBLNU459_g7661t2 [Dothideomycetes sp. NU459]
MAARRSLGGGRVLGSGKNLSPAVAAKQHQHTRNTSLLSPSESSVSLSSQTSSTPLSTETEDLASRVAIDEHGPSAAASASSRLVCPICNEEMLTLLQLNRHLDDNHQNLEEVEQDEVKNWFEQQMKKARKFQPLAVLNQKLKGLDVFEPNGTQTPPLIATPSRTISPSRASPAPTPVQPQIDPDEAVTKAHWQRFSGHDSCSDPLCGKRLGGANGNINCRHCGKLFCEEHTMYQMKLSRAAQYEPVRGYWCRVCETCYKTRPGYNDHTGFERNHNELFFATRRKTVDKAYLEISRLEKRLSRLTQLLANPPPPDPHEQITDIDSEKGTGQVGVDVRMCKDCQHTIFSKSDFARELALRPPDQRAYENLVQFERGIRLLTPKFQKLLVTLQHPDKPPTSAQLADATKVRKRLMDAFTQYDVAARRIRDLPTESPTQERLQKAIYSQATTFLHLHMLPLKSLPKIMKHASPHGAAARPPAGPLAAIRQDSSHLSPSSNGRPSIGDSRASSTSGASSAQVTALEAEEKELRERLIVLEEQKFFVSEMIADANKRRRFDEVGSLAQNVEDLSREIDQIQGQLAGMDFEGAYNAVD